MLGYSTSRDLSQAATTVGIKGADPGDMDAQMAALANYVNAHGGLLGHPVKLADYDVNAIDGSNNPDAAAQAACTFWTEDAHVFAVIDSVGLGSQSNTLQDCLAAHRTPLIAALGDGDGSAASYAKPYGPFSPDAMRVERYLPALVNVLVAGHYFAGWNSAAGSPGTGPVRIGLMHFDDPNGNAYAAALKKALAAHGMHVTDEASWQDGAQNASAGASSAVLRFRADGITHIFGANIVFYETAENQHYYPHYAVDDTIDTVALLATQPGIQKELHGAMGAGYLPYAEIPHVPDPAAASARCKRIMDAGGQTDWRTSTLALSTMLSECDDMFLLVDAIERSGLPSAEGVLSGVEGLGATYVPSATYRNTYARGRHDGAAGVRGFVYGDACGCFQFTSATIYPA